MIKVIAIIIFSLGLFTPKCNQHHDKKKESEMHQTVDNNSKAETLESVVFLFSKQDSVWADSVLAQMTVDEKIGQLFLIRTYSNKDEAYYKKIDEYIKKYKIGGLCFFQGTAMEQAELTNRWQSISRLPLLISIDGEWGLSMRLKDMGGFPMQITLGAIQDDSVIYRVGKAIGGQCKKTGIHINFAPVVDVNSNPKNPVINSRSFGQDPLNVYRKALAYIKGHIENGILTTAKHFPGHGDTDSDSHHTLPVVMNSRSYMDSVDLLPFKKLIEMNIPGIMVAHLHIPELDARKNSVSSLSKAIINDLLKEEMGFQGLVITDALEMQGVLKNGLPGEIELEAFLAGNDMLLLPSDLILAIQNIKKAVSRSKEAAKRLDESCKKILLFKSYLNLENNRYVNTSNLSKYIKESNYDDLRKEIAKKCITLVKNEDGLLPLKRLDSLKIAVVSISGNRDHNFKNNIDRYFPVTNYDLDAYPTKYQREKLLAALKKYNLVLFNIYNVSDYPGRKYGITDPVVAFFEETKVLKAKKIINVFGTPYSLGRIESINEMNAIVVSYFDDPNTEDYSSQIIFGAMGATGKIPVTVSPELLVNTGVYSETGKRLSYVTPKEYNINENELKRIDSIVNASIRDHIMPGCQILAAKGQKVFYHKAFGYHTYKKERAVTTNDLYDLASLTKILATTLGIMDLVEQKKIKLDDPMSKYYPELKGSNKEKITFREVMAHQAQLKPWIPFFLEVVIDNEPDKMLHSNVFSSQYPFQIASDLYMRIDYKDSIFKKIIDSPLRKWKKYRYSDLGFYMLKEVIEQQTSMPFETYLNERFYKPLGMHRTYFNPLRYVSSDEIVPSAIDQVYRKQELRGYVNDPGAAMLGGIAGHAGLFATANDIAKLLQMLLNNGEYGGERYFQGETIQEFTKYQYPLNMNRRGAGFDKPLLRDRNGQTCESASLSSYGHSGFTGTYVWVDPAEDLIYIFLANRTYPSDEENRLSKLDIRQRIHQFLYNSIQ